MHMIGKVQNVHDLRTTVQFEHVLYGVTFTQMTANTNFVS